MNIIAVDDEKIALEVLLSAIEKAEPRARAECFRNSVTALEFVEKNPCEIAFLDIEMREMNGVELAKRSPISLWKCRRSSRRWS